MYDFRSLSAYDFEVLVRDLLQEHFKVVIESFKAGRDGGIDLRYANDKHGTLIVQCKHYVNTGYSGLLSALKKEVPKVGRLKPSRYCIATSVPLSPDNKKTILQTFKPFCKSEQDILGSEDLNNMLGRYPDVERRHFKLWLASTAVLENIIHSGLYNQASVLVDHIQDKSRLYVQNESFFTAQELIASHNYCIISGIPGIGKTFLADMLLLQYISQGYQPVVVRSHIREAFDLLKSSTKQVFYYDDFLGQTGWIDKLEKNEDQSILDFISYVRSHKHARFILTTREYILQQARSIYEKLHASDFDRAKCIVRLEAYTRRDKAHILFNHVYFSELTEQHKRAISQKKWLLSIVDHKNYSPRIVEWMSDHRNVRDYTEAEYPRHFLNTLTNPRDLWRHAFINHISPASRALLMVMMSFESDVGLADLRAAFHSFRIKEAELFGSATSTNEFVASLDELEGSFVRCERVSDEIVISFHNPSVRDFLEGYLSENSEQLRILCESAIFYDQVRALCSRKSIGGSRPRIVDALTSVSGLISTAILRAVPNTAKGRKLYRRRDGSFGCHNQVSTSVEKNIEHAIGLAIELIGNDSIMAIGELLEMERSRINSGEAVIADVPGIIRSSSSIAEISPKRQGVVIALMAVFEDMQEFEELDDIVCLQEIITIEPDLASEELIDRVRKCLESDADAIFDWHISGAEDDSEIERLRDVVNSLEVAFGLTIREIHDQLDDRTEELKEQFEEPPDDDYRGSPQQASEASDSEVLSMFGSLWE